MIARPSTFGLKVLSVVLATMLWFAVAGEKTSERGFSAPVEFNNVPGDLEVISGGVNDVDVRLRASPSVMSQLGPQTVSAQVDLSDAGEGEHIVHLTPEKIRAPFGVRIVKVQPSVLTLNLERSIEREVQVSPRLVGRPAAGYEVASVAVEPPTVRLAGPRSHVEKLQTAYTEPISVEGLEASRTVDGVSVGFEDPTVHVEGISKVRVTAVIRPIPPKPDEAPTVSRTGGEATGRASTPSTR